MSIRGHAHITAGAVVPEQLLHYVDAVSGLQPVLCKGCVAHAGPGVLVLCAYPPHDPPYRDEDVALVDAAVAEAIRVSASEPAELIVQSFLRPSAAPAAAVSTHDMYWFLPLPLPPAGQKLRNMLRRAARDVRIVQSGMADGPMFQTISPDHEAVMAEFCAGRDLEPGTRHIFGHLREYLASGPDVRLFSAFSRHAAEAGIGGAVGRPLAWAVGDFSSLGTAFYMFAFRRPDAPPGTADALLAAVAAEGAARGHSRLNLGLGINSGVAFFKKKWGAQGLVACVETTWKPNAALVPEAATPAKESFLSRMRHSLFGS